MIECFCTMLANSNVEQEDGPRVARILDAVTTYAASLCASVRRTSSPTLDGCGSR